MKICPRCREKAERKARKCKGCGLRLHNELDCVGCVRLVGGQCVVFVDTNDPILKDDGSCLRRELDAAAKDTAGDI